MSALQTTGFYVVTKSPGKIAIIFGKRILGKVNVGVFVPETSAMGT